MLLKDVNDNPISLYWKNLYSAQSNDIKSKLDGLDNARPKDYQLKVIKKSKTEPVEGDIFVLSPREDIYFYGRVLKSNINHISQDTFVHGKSVVVIFKCKNNEISMSNYYPNYNDLLIRPEIVDKSYWSKGYFFTIENKPLDDNEKKLDYGFYSIGKGKFLKETGIEIDHQPVLLGTYGIATISGIAYEIEKELIIDSTLIEF